MFTQTHTHKRVHRHRHTITRGSFATPIKQGGLYMDVHINTPHWAVEGTAAHEGAGLDTDGAPSKEYIYSISM